MPRRRPPIDIFTFPVPEQMTSVTARCPACDGVGDPYGEIGSRMVFKCRECSVRFKGAATALIRRRQKQADV
ncbi:MAG: hypothetical protein QOK05_2413 [Chloroflexota bacterium]|jgi:tRNA(Ile2) C34 agmatinyltransferase TiaS|nr:hypothetical protein [Chloroflexota bacterium]